MSRPYRTAPEASSRVPGGIPYIVSNEAAERFSYYGMRTILVIFMTAHLADSSGNAAPMSEAEATGYFHLFASAVYFFPLIGALVSDVFLGKYRTILVLSIVYCFGHLALALDDTRLGLAVGLTLIAVGSGGIKPCVSAHVGDQFGATSSHLISRVFGWFYFAINLGAFISTLLTPWLLQAYGPHLAFGVPGILMFIATLAFWLGRYSFVHITPAGSGFLREAFGREGLGAMARLLVIYVFVAVFWALYDQTGSSWVLQARHMDRVFLGFEWLPSQVQAVNPVMIMAFIPLFSYAVYPAMARVFEPTPLRKILAGMLTAVPAFLIVAWVEMRLQAGFAPNIAWHFLAYAFLTAAEVMVSITCLEFSYTQAPTRMKSLVMALFMMSISMGNIFTATVNFAIESTQGEALQGPAYFLFFAGLMLAAALGFSVIVRFYKERTYLQDEAGGGRADAAPA